MSDEKTLDLDGIKARFDLGYNVTWTEAQALVAEVERLRVLTPAQLKERDQTEAAACALREALRRIILSNAGPFLNPEWPIAEAALTSPAPPCPHACALSQWSDTYGADLRPGPGDASPTPPCPHEVDKERGR